MRYVMRLLGIPVLLAFSLQAGAQTSFVPSGGEASEVLSCFYECKAGPVVGGVETFQEITTLMIANHGSTAEHGDVFRFALFECVHHRWKKRHVRPR